MKRNTITIGEVGSSASNRALAPAATKAENMKKRRGSRRSARENMADVRVPATKPTCTAEVIREAWLGERLYSRTRVGTTAEAENHKPNTATSQTANNARDHIRRPFSPSPLMQFPLNNPSNPNNLVQSSRFYVRTGRMFSVCDHSRTGVYLSARCTHY